MRRPVAVRPLLPGDLPEVAEILRDAFTSVYEEHGFLTPFPNLEGATWLSETYSAMPYTVAHVAEQAGDLVGVAFLHLRGPAASLGPVAARTAATAGVGRALVQSLLGVAGTRSGRLLQDACHSASFALYTKLGFRALEPVAYAVTDRLERGARAPAVAPVGPEDLAELLAFDRLHTGMDRGTDLTDALATGTGHCLRREGRIRGFLLSRRGAQRLVVAPAVAETAAQLRALLEDFAHRNVGLGAALRAPAGPALGGDGQVLASLLALGFRIEHLGNLMVRGAYPEAPGCQLLAIFPESL